MATIILGAVGAAVGGGFGGTVLGLSGAVIGRAVGATIGRAIDQRLLGAGSQAVETGRVDRFRLTGASEGAAVARIWGRMRVGGQVIWSSDFSEHVRTSSSRGGKGMSGPTVTEYSYSVSIAVALCEGEIAGIGRIWADGVEISRGSVAMRVYTGSDDQLPDPKIEAVEGAGAVPAYRGIAYVVFEDLALEPYGNRVPQFTFEVVRRAASATPGGMAGCVRAVAMIPGTGEYALATTPVHFSSGLGEGRSVNVSTPDGRTDFAVSLEALERELPACGSVSLVVSWFGDDLRCGACKVRPLVEQKAEDGQGMAWRVNGVARAGAGTVPLLEGRPVYGGTPADRSVVEAIQALNAAGRKVMFYPFLLMSQLAGNGLADPYGGAEQAALPWRGRITGSAAPGQAGSPEGTAAADAQVAAFFGTAGPGHFPAAGGLPGYSGPAEWSYRRFILHYAHLAKLAGGVDAFCIGSEMRGLTSLRGAGGFPAVAALKALAADVRAILGPGVKIGYAADWSEYSGHTDTQGNRWFHLDPLWSDANVDFVGIDNYMPLSDWREGEDHADAGWGSIYNLDYLKANVQGGEGYDWFYASDAAAAAQIRTPITDGAYGEPWVWRVKDLRNWWSNAHHERVGGVRQAAATAWVPGSKPVWFTEIGCPAVDKGTNEPNRFLDVKSSESALPKWSDGRRDDLIQMQYLRALDSYWGDAANNPMSEIYGGPMVDMSRAHVWAWDARPFPAFPNDLTRWSDGVNHARGHWITGRTTAEPLAAVVAEICAGAGVGAHDVSALHGLVRGYAVEEVGTGRAALQPLMTAHGMEAVERGGVLRFLIRDGRVTEEIGPDRLAVSDEMEGTVELVRAPEAEVSGRVRLVHVEAEGDYETRATEAVFPDEAGQVAAQNEMAMALTGGEARAIAERWLAEARVARDGARFALPPSLSWLGAGDVVALPGAGRFRIDRVEEQGMLIAEAVRVEPGVYRPAATVDDLPVPRAVVPALPVYPVFLDLPLLTGDEVEHAPHLAVAATPWPGTVAVFSSASGAGYALDRLVTAPAVVGQTLNMLAAAEAGIWDRGPDLLVRVAFGAFESAEPASVLAGANAVAIGDGSAEGWEVFQFAEAELVGTGVYALRHRLRGQAGTDAEISDRPAGSIVVLLNGAVGQVGLPASARGVARHWRIGPAARSYDDGAYVERVEAFRGIGLRPYRPAHLRVRQVGSALEVGWIRRTRIDGDGWETEAPVGEAAERYVVRVVRDGLVLREVEVGEPRWTYAAPMRAADGPGGFGIQVAQMSDRFGPGPFAEVMIDD